MEKKYVINESTLKRIANALRGVNGTSKTYTPLDMDTEIENVMESASYIIVDEYGAEIMATYLEPDTSLTATENDIRNGMVAVTNDGLITGTKEIPAYHTSEGFKAIPNGSTITLPILNYDYTRLQAIICSLNTTLDNSVAATKVVINNSVYPVGSTVAESNVTVDNDKQYINLGITNLSGSPILIRYFTYKEIY